MPNFKIACHSANFPEVPIHRLIKELSLFGYDAIEINATTLPYAEPHISADISQVEMDKLKDTLSEHNLSVSSICAHTNLTDPSQQEESIEFTKKCIQLASKLGTSIVQGSSGVKPASISEEEAWSVLEENVNELTSFAEDNGVKFTFEPVVVMLVNNSESYQKIKNLVKKGNLFINYDPSQLVVVGDNTEDFIRKFHKEIVHVHIKDGKGTKDSFEFPPLGQGEVQFTNIMKELEEIGYNGYLSVEYEAHVFGYEKDKEKVCSDSLKFINQL